MLPHGSLSTLVLVLVLTTTPLLVFAIPYPRSSSTDLPPLRPISSARRSLSASSSLQGACVPQQYPKQGALLPVRVLFVYLCLRPLPPTPPLTHPPKYNICMYIYTGYIARTYS